MTSHRPTSSWPVAIGYWFAGAALTAATFSLAGAIGGWFAGGLGVYGFQLVGAAGIFVAVVVGVRLPRRARAMFVAGVFTPLALGVAFLIWLVWALSQSNFTF